MNDDGIVMTDIKRRDTSSMRVVDQMTKIEQTYPYDGVVGSHMNKSKICCRQHKLYLYYKRLSESVTIKNNCKLQNETGFVQRVILARK